MEGAQDIGEHKSNVVGQSFGEDGGQRRECIVGTDSDTGNGSIGEDENGSDRVDVLPNLGLNTLLVEFILLNTASISQPRGVEDTDLGNGLHELATVQNTCTYYYAVAARKFI